MANGDTHARRGHREPAVSRWNEEKENGNVNQLNGVCNVLRTKKKETQVFFSPVVAMDKFCPNKRQESKGYLHEGTRYTKKRIKSIENTRSYDPRH
jgi:hypothetical protein